MRSVGFVSEPNCGRGTISIVWSCISTFFLLTYTSLHPDVDDDQISFMLYCLAFPEFGAVGAVSDLIYAFLLRKTMLRIHDWDHLTLQHGFLVRLGGVVLEGDGEAKTTVTGRILLGLAQDQAIELGDLPTLDQMKNGSRKDYLSKAIALLQCLWFTANILSRLVNRFEVSLLEDLTMAYVLCGILMYASWFHCPQGIREPFALRCNAGSAANLRRPVLLYMSDRLMFGFGVIILGLFVAIHLGAWHYPFPTAIEMWLWRVCAIMTFVLGVTTAWLTLDHSEHPIATTILILYALARVTVIGVAFSVFRQAPAEIYEKLTWSSYWGHIGS